MPEHTDFQASFRRALKSVIKKEDLSLIDDDPTASVDIPTTLGYETGEKTAKVTPINLFQQPEVHPVVLDLILLRKYGAEWLLWESETLEWAVTQDFNTTGVSELNLSKIQAMKTLHYNDNFWLQWEVFNWCTYPLNNVFPNFEIMQAPSTAQMMVSVSTAAVVRADVAWSEEVKQFMVTACKYDGIFCPPPPLDFLSVMPDNDFIDCEAISDRWAEVKRTKVAPTKDTIIDEQLRRMLEAYRFLLVDRQRLESQMPLVVASG